jgi:hypothetical protein
MSRRVPNERQRGVLRARDFTGQRGSQWRTAFSSHFDACGRPASRRSGIALRQFWTLRTINIKKSFVQSQHFCNVKERTLALTRYPSSKESSKIPAPKSTPRQTTSYILIFLDTRSPHLRASYQSFPKSQITTPTMLSLTGRFKSFYHA